MHFSLDFLHFSGDSVGLMKSGLNRFYWEMEHNMDDTKKLDVCLIGHFFLTRLNGYMQSNRCYWNLNLNVDKFHISVCACRGLRVSQSSSSNF